MTKKYAAGIILFVLSALLLLGGALFYAKYKESADVKGRYTFTAGRNKINYIGKAVITSPEGEITLYRAKDGSWHFKEAKDYFVNEDVLAGFMEMIKDSVIVSVREADEKTLRSAGVDDKNGTRIRTYGHDSALLDDVVLGRGMSADGLMPARRTAEKSHLYGISSANEFSAAPQDWIPYPLLSVKTEDIREVVINGKKTGYDDFNKLLGRSKAWRDFASALEYIDYYGLTFKSDLADLPADVKVRRIDVLMLTGMYYKLTVIETEGSYWLVISMDAQKVFSTEAVKVATETYRYYADWVFRMSDEQGKALFSDELLKD